MVTYVLFCNKRSAKNEDLWAYQCGDKVLQFGDYIDKDYVKFFGDLENDYNRWIVAFGHKKYKRTDDKVVIDGIIEDLDQALYLLLDY